jgi:hypothetical protein
MTMVASDELYSLGQPTVLDSSSNTRRRKPVPSRIDTDDFALDRYHETATPPARTTVSQTPTPTPQVPPTRTPPPPPTPPDTPSASLEAQSDQALLLNTASAAQWRRRDNHPINSRNATLQKLRGRSNSELVLQVKVMEEVHGVDVSWLHHPNKGIQQRKRDHASFD